MVGEAAAVLWTEDGQALGHQEGPWLIDQVDLIGLGGWWSVEVKMEEQSHSSVTANESKRENRFLESYFGSLLG